MMLTSSLVYLLAISSLCVAQTYTGPEDSRLTTALTTDVPINGVCTTPDGRLFVLYARVDGSHGPQVAEYNRDDNSTTPYPDVRWNSYTVGDDPSNYLVRTNSLRIGPDGYLYFVDVGSPSFGAPVILPDGPKLVQVDLTTNQVSRIYPMGNATRSVSLLDDVRFNLASGKAYLTDAGAPGLIVLDLASGITRRVLENDPSTRGSIPISAEGSLVGATGGGYSYIHADQLELSSDGTWLYYQPASGGLSRIRTTYLDQAFYNSSLSEGPLASYVEPFAHTPSTGGTAIDAEGNFYNSDTDSQRVIKIAPNGTMTTLVQDPRLLWVDAMWIDSNNQLWMPAAQLNRGIPFNNGTSRVVKPTYVFTMDIGVGPSTIDHA